MNPVLMQGHSLTFDGLVFHLREHHLGTAYELDYRVDAGDMAPVVKKLQVQIPPDENGFVFSGVAYEDEPDADDGDDDDDI